METNVQKNVTVNENLSGVKLDKYGLVKVANPFGRFFKNIILGLIMLIVAGTGAFTGLTSNLFGGNISSDSTGSGDVTVEAAGTAYLHANWKSAISGAVTLSSITSIEFTSTEPTTGTVYNVGAENADTTVLGPSTAFTDSVKAYVDGTTVKIFAAGTIYAPIDCGYLFSDEMGMFSFSSLETILFNNFNTSQVFIMSRMFQGCTSLISLDLSMFVTNIVETTVSMFGDCDKLQNLDISSFDMTNTNEAAVSGMFSNCDLLTSIKVPKINPHTDIDLPGETWYKADDGSVTYTTLPVTTGTSFEITNVKPVTEAYLHANWKTQLVKVGGAKLANLTSIEFTSDSSLIDGLTTYYNVGAADASTAYHTTGTTTFTDSVKAYKKSDTEIIIYAQGTIYAPTNSKYLFSSNSSSSQLTALTTLTLTNFNTSFVTNMSYMFYRCSKLASIDVSNFNTSNVTTMGAMFYYCSNLKSLDLNGFNTSNVTSMASMFYSCSGLTSLNISNFNTSRVTGMGAIFFYCSKLTNLDVSKFDTRNVKDMFQMFIGCSKLNSLDVSKFNTSNVGNMYSMFSGCSELTNLDVSKFDTSSVTNMNSMFYGCDSLTSLNVSKFDTSSVKYMKQMFSCCSGLTSLDLSNFVTNNVTSMGYMFDGCSSLTSLDISSFDTRNVMNMEAMFDDCSSLISLDISKFNMTSVTSYSSMFTSCNALVRMQVPYYVPSTISLDLPGTNWYETANLSNVHTTLPITSGTSAEDSFEIVRGYLVTYDANGGEGAPEQQFKVHGEDLTLSSTIPTLANYDFKGWATSADSTTVSYEAGATYSTNANITLYAVWKPADVYLHGNWQLALTNGGMTVPSLTSIVFTSDSSLIDGLTTYYNVGAANANTTYITTDTTTFIDTVKAYKKSDTEVIIYSPGTICAPIDSTYLFSSSSSSSRLTALTTLTLSNINTSSVTDMYSMFYGCSALTSLDVSSFVTSKVTNMSRMFSICSKLTSLDVSNFNTSSVTDMEGMFSDCIALTSLDLSSFVTINVTNMSHMFYYCRTLTSLDVSSFVTINVTNMSGMFSTCSALTSLDVSNFDTSKVKNIRYMFSNCSALTSLDVSNFNTSNVTIMGEVFQNCSSLTSLNVSKFNTNNTTFMYFMFTGCRKLTSLDLSNFNTSKVTNMTGMFSNCSSLTSLNLSGFDMTKVTSYNSMFNRCNALARMQVPYYMPSTISLDLPGTNWYETENLSSVHTTLPITSGTSAEDSFEIARGYLVTYNANGGEGAPEQQLKVYGEDLTLSSTIPTLANYDFKGWATSADATEVSYAAGATYSTDADITLYAVWKPADVYLHGNWQLALTNGGMTPSSLTSIVFTSDSSLIDGLTTYYNVGAANANTTYITTDTTTFIDTVKAYKKSDTEVIIYSPGTICAPIDSTYLFSSSSSSSRLTALTTLTLSNINTSSVTDMYSMFYGCSALTSLDVSNFDTSKVKNIRYMFSNCSALTSLDVSNFNTSNVTIMGEVFQNCSSLTSLNVSKFNTNNTTFMYFMFTGCSKLTSLDLSNFNTSKVTNMTGMFANCSSLTSLDVSNFDTSSVTNMSSMFSDCSALTSLDLRGFNTNSVTNMSSMFSECIALTSLDVSSFDTSSVTNMSSMFSKCIALTSLDVSSFDTSSVTNMSSMFYNCRTLTSLDVSSFDTSSVTNMSSMFYGCSALTSLDVSSFVTSKVTNMSRMFSICSKLTSLDVSNFNTSSVTNMSLMFSRCSGLTSLDVSNFNTSSVTSMSAMFTGCSKLTSLDVSGFNTSSVTSMSSMFSGCSGLTSLDISKFNMTSVTSYSSMFTSCNALVRMQVPYYVPSTINLDLPGTNWYKTENLSSVHTTLPITSGTSAEDSFEIARGYLVTYNANGGEGAPAQQLKVYGEDLTLSSTIPTLANYDFLGWATSADSTTVSYEAGSTYSTDADITLYAVWKPADVYLHGNWQLALTNGGMTVPSLTSIVFTSDSLLINGLTTYYNVGAADASTKYNTTDTTTFIDTVKAYKKSDTEVIIYAPGTIYAPKNSQYLFSSNYSNKVLTALTNLTLTNFDTSNVVNMSSMFRGLSGLTSLDLSNFNTSNVTDMSYLFAYCNGLTTLDLSNFNTSKVTDMRSLFHECSGLTGTFGVNGTAIKISSKFDTSSVTNMESMFFYCISLSSIDVSSFSTSNVTSMASMFSGCNILTSLDISNFDTAKVTDMSSMFTGMKRYSSNSYSYSNNALQEIKFGANFNTISVKNMNNMFYGCKNITSLDLSKFNTSSVTSMRDMFSYCSGLTSLDLSNFNTSKVTDMVFLFRECSGLTGTFGVNGTAIKISSNFDTSSVTNMGSMFHGCSGLTSLDLTNFNISNVKNMSGMFYNCSGLTNLNLSNFNTSSVTDMSYMLNGCSGLTSLDLSNFDTSSVITMYSMFYGCSGLTSLNLSSFDMANVTSYNYMFSGCNALKTIQVPKTNAITDIDLPGETWYKTEDKSITYTTLPETNGTSFEITNEPPYAYLHGNWQLALTNGGMTPSSLTSIVFTNDSSLIEGLTTYYSVGAADASTTYTTTSTTTFTDTVKAYKKSDTEVIIYSPVTIYAPTNSTYLFSATSGQLTALTTLTLSNFDTSKVTNMSNMFNSCTSLANLDLSSFVTINVTNMSHMFYYCRTLTSLDVSSFVTINVTNMSGMFSTCSALTSLDVSGFVTSSVTNMGSMFSSCSNLTSLNLSNFDTSNVTSMSSMFSSCSNLTSLNLSNFDTSNVTNMYGMFDVCTSLTSLDLSNFNMTKVTSYLYMFSSALVRMQVPYYVPSTISLDLPGTSWYETDNLSSVHTTLPLTTGTSAEDSFEIVRGYLVTYNANGGSGAPEQQLKVHGEELTLSSIAPTRTGYNFNGWATSADATEVSYAAGATYSTDADITLYAVWKPADVYLHGNWQLALTNGGMTPSSLTSIVFTSDSSLIDGLTTYYNVGAADASTAYHTTDTTTFTDSVKAYKKSDTEIIIYAPGTICAPKNSSYLFSIANSSSQLTALTTLTLTNLDTSKVEYMSSMFYGCSALTSLDISKFDTVNVKGMRFMFSDCSSLTTLDLSGFDTSKVTNMGLMFGSCRGLTGTFGVNGTAIKISSKFVTSSVTDMGSMFGSCRGLTSIDVSNFDTSSVTNMGTMFYGCSGLTSLDLRAFNTSNVTDMEWMLVNCSGLTSIDLSSFNTSNVTDMSSMFNNCTGLTTLDLSNFNTSNVINMSWMFSRCNLTSLDLSSFNTSNVTDMSYMFYDCTNLTNLDISSFDMTKVTNYSTMFTDCNALTRIQVPKINAKTDIDLPGSTWYRADDSSVTYTNLPETNGTSFEITNVPPYVYLHRKWISAISDGGMNLSSLASVEFTSDSSLIEGLTTYYNVGAVNATTTDISNFIDTVKAYRKSDTEVIIYAPGTICAPSNSSYLFSIHSSNIESNEFTTLTLTNFITSGVTNMSNMFYYCSGLTSLDLSGFNTSNVTNMSYMFYNCRSLTSLDVSGFNTSSVINMNSMFCYCSGLTSLDVSGFNTSSVTNMSSMFSGCNKIMSLDVINFDTSSVTSMYEMFCNCSSLIRLDVSKFVTNSVSTMGRMFQDCNKIVNLDVSSFNTSSVTSMYSMFYSCRSLTSLDVSGFNTSSVTDMSYMFSHCSSLTSLYINNFDTSSVKDMSCMFRNCSSLTSLDISNLNTSSVTNMSEMFSGSNKLTSLDFSNFNTSNVTDMNRMFSGCSKLTSLNLSKFNTSKVTNMRNMFTECNELTSLDVSSFDTSGIDSMFSMFYRCYSLTCLDLSSFDTSNVTDMASVFTGCTVLTSLDLSSFDTSNVTEMWGMFSTCSSLTSLNLSSFNMAKVTSYTNIFSECNALVRMQVPYYVPSSISLDLPGDNWYKTTNLNNVYTNLPIISGTSAEDSFEITRGYLVTYNANGGEGAPATQLKVYGEVLTLSSTVPTKTECNFLGWGTSSTTGTVRYTPGAVYSTNKKLSLYAIWGVEGNCLHANWKLPLINGRMTITSITSVVFTSDSSLIDGLTTYFNVGATIANTTYQTSDTTTFTDTVKAYKKSGTEIIIYASDTIYAPSDSSYLFSSTNTSSRLTALTTLTLTNFDTSKVTNMNFMFASCSSLISLDLSGFDTSSVTNMSGMFSRSSITSVNLSSFNTSNVTTMGSMFYSCSSLTSIDLSSFNTSNVTTMYSMFYSCSSLTSIDLTNFNTGNVTNMQQLFYNCNGLISINLSGFNTINVTRMDSMFYSCSKLTSLDLSSFNTSNVTRLYQMFWGCSGLMNLDLSNFNTAKVTNINGMLYNCSSLRTLDISGFNLSALTSKSSDLISDCNSTIITSIKVPKVNGHSNYFDLPGDTWYKAGDPSITYTTLPVTTGNSFEIINMAPHAYLHNSWKDQIVNVGRLSTSSITSIEFTKDESKIPAGVTAIPVAGSESGYGNYTNIIQAYVNGTNVIVYSTYDITISKNSGSNLFTSLTALKTLILDNINTQYMTSMYNMFYGCSSLTSLDLSNFNTENVTNMYYIFYGCTSLTTLDLSSFNTEKVTNMDSMFYNCSKLTSLDLSSFNTTKITSMWNMFYGCSSLTSLDLSSFNTEKVTDIDNMFENCTNLIELDLSSFNLSTVSNTDNVFTGCDSLAVIQVPKINSKTSITLPAKTWYNADDPSITYKNLPVTEGTSFEITTIRPVGYLHANWLEVISSVIDLNTITSIQFTNAKPTYENVYNVGAVDENSTKADTNYTDDVKAYINGTNVIIFSVTETFAPKDSSQLFYINGKELASLSNITFNNFYTTKVINMDSMFKGCSALIALNLSSFDTSNVTSMSNIFDNCTELMVLDISSFDLTNVTSYATIFNNCYSLTVMQVPKINNVTIDLPGETWYNSSDSNITYTNLPITTGTSFEITTSKTSEAFLHAAWVNIMLESGINAEDLLDVTSIQFTKQIGLIPAGVTAINVGAFDANSTVNTYNAETITNTVKAYLNGTQLIMYSPFIICAPANSSYLFAPTESLGGNFEQLSTLSFTDFKTDYVTSMKGMFAGCKSLTIFDLSEFITSNVTDISEMFNGCTDLMVLDISSFDLTNVTSYANIFNNCDSLIVIEVPKVNSIESIDLPGDTWCKATDSSVTFTTLPVTTGTSFEITKGASSEAFLHASWKNIMLQAGVDKEELLAITSITFTKELSEIPTDCIGINVGAFDENSTLEVFTEDTIANTIKAYLSGTNLVIYSPFTICAPKDSSCLFVAEVIDKATASGVGFEQLLTIDFNNFNTNYTTDMFGMFGYTTSLKSIDLTCFNTNKVTTMMGMFAWSGISGTFGREGSAVKIGENFSTANVENFSYMFSGCTGLTSIDLSSFDTTSLIYMDYMFYGCTNLIELNLSGLDLTNVTSYELMFTSCDSLTVIQVPKTNAIADIALPNGTWYKTLDKTITYTALPTTTNESFEITMIANDEAFLHPFWMLIMVELGGVSEEVLAATTIEFTNDVNKIPTGVTGISVGDVDGKTTMDNFTEQTITNSVKAYFSGTKVIIYSPLQIYAPVDSTALFTPMLHFEIMLENLNTIIFDNFSTKYTTNMLGMFAYSPALTSLDLTSFDTSNVTDMSGMFAYSGFSGTFGKDGTAIKIGEKFTTAKVTSMASMFYESKGLTSIDLSSFDTTSLSVVDGMFAKCTGLIILDISSFDMTNVTSYADMFAECTELTIIQVPKTNAIADIALPTTGLIGTYVWYKTLDKAITYTTLPTTTNESFEITILATDEAFLNTMWIYVPLMLGEQYGIALEEMLKIETIELTRDINKIPNGAQAMPVGDIDGSSSFNADNIETTLCGTVKAYYNGTTLIIYSPFQINSAIDAMGLFGYMGMMFMKEGIECYISSIILDNFSTKYTTSMDLMFGILPNLNNIDTSKFDTSNVTSMMGMFAMCSSLTELDVSSFDTSKVMNMMGMFAYCPALTSLDLTNFDTGNVLNMSGLFAESSGLTGSVGINGTAIKFGEKFTTANVTDMSAMFSNCAGLTSINLSGFDTTKVTTIDSMFSGCSSLSTVNLSGFNTSSVTSYVDLFKDCDSLVRIDVPETNAIADIEITSGNWYKVSDCSLLTSNNLPITTSETYQIVRGYLVTYDANGGEGAPEQQLKVHGEDITLSSTIPTRTGYIFNGWAATADATEATYAAGATYSTDEDLDLFAVWSLEIYSIIIDSSGADTEGSVNPTEYTVKTSSQTATLTLPVRNGYDLSWTITGYTGDAPTIDGTTLTIPANTYGNITLTAVWTEKEYVVKGSVWYDGVQGSMGAVGSQYVYIRYNNAILTESGVTAKYLDTLEFVVRSNAGYKIDAISYTYVNDSGVSETKENISFTQEGTSADYKFNVEVLGTTTIRVDVTLKEYNVTVNMNYDIESTSKLYNVVGLNVYADISGTDLTGTISGSSITYAVNYYDLVNMYIMPETGFEISGMTVDGESRDASNAYYISKTVEANVTVNVTLTSNTWLDHIETGTSFTGEGTEASPYVIETASQLAKLALDVFNGTTYSGKYFLLKDNIDLSGYNWYPIGTVYTLKTGIAHTYKFAGTFLGDYYNIENMQVVNGNGVGLFGYNAGTVTNVNIAESSSVIGGNYVGGVVGYNQGTVKNVSNAGTVTGYSRKFIADNAVGGIVGYNTAEVIANYSYANVNGYAYSMGGLVGYNAGNGIIYHGYVVYLTDSTSKVENSLTNAIGLVDANGAELRSAVGGIVGRSVSTATNSGVQYVYFVGENENVARVIIDTREKAGYIIGESAVTMSSTSLYYYNLESDSLKGSNFNTIGYNTAITSEAMKHLKADGSHDDFTTSVFASWNESSYGEVWEYRDGENGEYPVFVQDKFFTGEIRITYSVAENASLLIRVVGTNGAKYSTRVTGSGTYVLSELETAKYKITFSTIVNHSISVSAEGYVTETETETVTKYTVVSLGTETGSYLAIDYTVTVNHKGSTGFYA